MATVSVMATAVSSVHPFGAANGNASWDVLIVAVCVVGWILVTAGLAAAMNARDHHRQHR